MNIGFQYNARDISARVNSKYLRCPPPPPPRSQEDWKFRRARVLKYGGGKEEQVTGNGRADVYRNASRRYSEPPFRANLYNRGGSG